MRLAAMILSLVFASTANAFYKCKNEDGSFSFSDAPCGVMQDGGVDLEKEQRFKEQQEQKKSQELQRIAMEQRERRAKLIEVRRRKDVFARQYAKIIEADAWPHYTEKAYPELEKKYYDRMIDIENDRLTAVRLVLNSQKCDKVASSHLDRPSSTPEKLVIRVTCKNGTTFHLTEKDISDGAGPVPLNEEEP